MIEILLAVLAVIGVANLIGLAMLWTHMDRKGTSISDHGSRITRLEERQLAAISQHQVLQIHERLANIEGSVTTTKELMKTIQEHLLERDE